MQQMQEHVERYEASIVFDHIDSVDLETRPFTLKGSGIHLRRTHYCHGCVSPIFRLAQ